MKSFAAVGLVAGLAAALPADSYGESAATTTYACNPAHSYPNGATCISTAGSLTLVTPPASTTTYACNPAHSYPNGATCISTAGSLTLVTPSASATPSGDKESTCSKAYDQCRGAPDANFSYCASKYAECLGYNPFTSSASSSTVKTAPPATTTTPAKGDEKACSKAYDQCRGAPDANFSYCASKYAECLGYNPFANNGTNTVTPKESDTYVTQVVTRFTTYCPEPTTLTYQNKTYTVTSATTLTISDCPCTITTPAKSATPITTGTAQPSASVPVTPKKSDTYVTQVVTRFTTYCPEPTTLTFQDKTYTVASATTLTISDCPCTITTPIKSATGTAQPPASVPVTPVTQPGTVVPTGNAPSQTVSVPSTTRASTPYTGAADKLNVGGALMIGALGLLAL